MTTFWDFLWKLFMWIMALAIPTLVSGCMALDPVGQIGILLEKPAVQSTLDKWAVRGSIQNPRVGGILGTSFELYLIGMDAQAEASGDVRSPGIDAETLNRLTIIAERLAAKLAVPVPPPATQPSPVTP